MKIAGDPAKRQKTLNERRLDFTDAGLIFAGEHFTREDNRKDYGELQFITVGFLRERVVVMVWIPREDGTQHITSMRKANEGEQVLLRTVPGLTQMMPPSWTSSSFNRLIFIWEISCFVAAGAALSRPAQRFYFPPVIVQK